jgi:hypothetical protein
LADDITWEHFDGDGKVASFRHIGDLAREEIPFHN